MASFYCPYPRHVDVWNKDRYFVPISDIIVHIPYINVYIPDITVPIPDIIFCIPDITVLVPDISFIRKVMSEIWPVFTVHIPDIKN